MATLAAADWFIEKSLLLNWIRIFLSGPGLSFVLGLSKFPVCERKTGGEGGGGSGQMYWDSNLAEFFFFNRSKTQ